MMKRIIAVMLAVLMIFALVGCGSQKREIIQLTFATEDAEAILAAAGVYLPDVEDAAAAGTVVKYYGWTDTFHNYSDDEIINTGYWTFTQKYGCEVEWIECAWDVRFDSLATLILATDSPDCYPGEANTFPTKAIKGLFQPVDNYIDYDDPLWSGMKDYIYTYFSIKGRPYIIGTDTSYGQVCAYNRRVVDEWGFDDPAELFYNDQWTWDVFYEMCIEFSDPDEDRYALDGWGFSSGLMRSCGTTVVTYDTETQLYSANLDDPRLERAANLLYDLQKNECIFPWWNNNWSLRFGTEGGGINEGLALFYIRYDFCFTGTVAEMSPIWGDIAAGELMFVPMPRDDDGDGNYYTESQAAGYCIVVGAPNPEGVALLAACDRFKVLDPTVIAIDRRQKEEIYLWTEEMLDMYDTCYELSTLYDKVMVCYDAGYGDKLADVIGYFEENGHVVDYKTWAQLKETYSDMLDYYVEDLNNTIIAYEPVDY